MSNPNEICVDCGDSVALGSGKYVNRIPASRGDDANHPKGAYLCADCQMVECDRCGKPTLEYALIDDEAVCDDCLGQMSMKNKCKVMSGRDLTQYTR